MKYWKYKIFPVSALLSLCLVNSLLSAPREFKGEVSKMEGDVIIITFEDEWSPVAGDPVSISTNLAGRILDAGDAEVTEVGDGYVLAKVLSGNPNIRMTAMIVSENPVPKNMGPDEAYTTGLALYRKAFPPDADVFDWFGRGNMESADYQAGVSFLKKAAEQGHAEAQYLYAKHFNQSTFDLKNFGQGKPQPENPWLVKAADAGVPQAQLRLGMDFLFGIGREKDKERGLAYLKLAADQGYPEAAFEYSMAIENPEQAESYRLKAAEGGFVRAQEYVGANYLTFSDGEGLAPFNLEKGVYWLEKAADNGSRKALVMLGDLYYNGGVAYPQDIELKQKLIRSGGNPEIINRWLESKRWEKDINKAHEYYRHASLQSGSMGDPFYRLGMIHSEEGTEFFNPAEAVAWYQKGAAQNQVRSIIALSRCYRLGWGTDGNPQEAFTLATKAHKNWPEDGQSSTELALCYRDGIGTARDPAKAFQLLSTVADRELNPDPYAIVYLGDLYREGIGTTRDLAKAFAYYQKAASVEGSGSLDEDKETAKAMAYARIARAYTYGEGVEKDSTKVFENSSQALRLDPNQPLALRCGALFLFSFGDKDNQAKAAGVFEKAADNGDVESHYLLGSLYAKGEGVEKNKDTAISRYQSAAREGHAKAQAELRKLNVSW